MAALSGLVSQLGARVQVSRAPHFRQRLDDHLPFFVGESEYQVGEENEEILTPPPNPRFYDATLPDFRLDHSRHHLFFFFLFVATTTWIARIPH